MVLTQREKIGYMCMSGGLLGLGIFAWVTLNMFYRDTKPAVQQEQGLYQKVSDANFIIQDNSTFLPAPCKRVLNMGYTNAHDIQNMYVSCEKTDGNYGIFTTTPKELAKSNWRETELKPVKK